MPMDPALFSLVLFLASFLNHVTYACPPPCMCLDVSSSVHCSRKKLPFIPEGIPTDVHDLYLNNNEFENAELRRSNVSSFLVVRHLYLNDCGIQKIRQDTFSDLKFLRHLDLNNNKIRVIEDYTFRGLTLEHLFMGNNAGLEIKSLAFHGLTVDGLYLQRCAIKGLHHDVFKPLNQTLKTLNLEENSIETFTREWEYIIRTFVHVRLGHNPFHCNCELRWLHRLYTDKNSTILASTIAPSCRSPSRLRSKSFTELMDEDFTCDLPVFSSVDVDLGLDSGRLFCQARGDPTPEILWLSPTGKFHLYSPSMNESIKENQGLLDIQKTAGKTREVYVCLAKNPGGNATVNVTVTWPPITIVEAVVEQTTTVTTPVSTEPPTEKITTPRSTTSTTKITTQSHKQASEIVTHHKTPPDETLPVLIVARPNNELPRSFKTYESAQIRNKNIVISSQNSMAAADHYFTLIQLVSSIVGTFVFTLLLCALVFHFYHRRQRRLLYTDNRPREKTPDNVYVTSDIDEQTLKMMTNNQHNQMREQMPA